MAALTRTQNKLERQIRFLSRLREKETDRVVADDLGEEYAEIKATLDTMKEEIAGFSELLDEFDRNVITEVGEMVPVPEKLRAASDRYEQFGVDIKLWMGDLRAGMEKVKVAQGSGRRSPLSMAESRPQGNPNPGESRNPSPTLGVAGLGRSPALSWASVEHR